MSTSMREEHHCTADLFSKVSLVLATITGPVILAAPMPWRALSYSGCDIPTHPNWLIRTLTAKQHALGVCGSTVTWKREAHNVGIGCASAILLIRKTKNKFETPFQMFNCLVVDAILWLSAMKSERRARLLGCICRLHIGCCHQLLKVTGPVTAVSFNFIRARPAFKWGVLYGSPYYMHLKRKKPVYS